MLVWKKQLNSSEVYVIANNIFRFIIMNSYEKKVAPGLISNIDFSKFNKELNLDLISIEAMTITALVNQCIL